MDMTGLEYFVSAARHLNFTKAARECFITQTAMSLHIAKLEKQLGFRLFFREKRTVRLTPGGLSFYSEARKILRQYRESITRSARIAAGFEGVIRLGFTNYIERGILPVLVNIFREKYPRIEIVLNKSEQKRVMEDLREGLNDVSLVFPYDCENDPLISMKTMESYNVCAVVQAGHTTPERKTINLREMEKKTLIVGSRSSSPLLYDRMREDWQRYSFSPAALLEVDSADAILFMVEAGFGCALMPSYVRQLENSRIRVLDLEGVNLSVETALAYSEATTNPAVNLFLEEMDSALIKHE